MKLFFTFFISLISLNILNATDQVSDHLIYKNEKLLVEVGWGNPSPLETYYEQNNIDYPFQMLSTGNYRGHIAHWKIENERLYITEIEVRDETFKPSHFNVKSTSTKMSSENQVFADWFSGILVCRKTKKNWETEYYIYFYIKNGMVVEFEKIRPKEIERIINVKEGEELDSFLKSKYKILYMNQSYISYYFRLYDDEHISIGERKGHIKGKNEYSIVLDYFDNDHLKWPYNWENMDLNGAPNGTWEIKDNKLFLISLNLNTGLNFDGAETIKIDLSTVFTDKPLYDNKLFADWTNGIYLIRHGEEQEDNLLPGFKYFKETDYTFVRIKNGEIIEQHNISQSFNFEKYPEDTDESLRKILDDYKSQ